MHSYLSSCLLTLPTTSAPHSFILPGAALFALSTYLLLHRLPSPIPDIIPSSRVQLLSLTPHELESLPYRPDFFPGSRWVKTPYGTTLVFEFGPETGRKVVLVHGISTPCCVFRDLVYRLVEEGGCRVILYDLYGRGYSDTPTNTPFTHALFSTQLLCVLASSPLPWLSGPPTNTFSIIGYSFGGSLIPPFLSTLPESHLSRLDSFIFLAPGGLLSEAKLPLLGRLGYHGCLPSALERMVAKGNMRKGGGEGGRHNTDRTKELDVNAVAGWQARSNPGFLRAWIGSFRSGPLFDGHLYWRGLRDMLDRGQVCGARRGREKILVVLGSEDQSVKLVDVEPELTQVFGEITGEVWGWRKKVIEGAGHDLVARRGVDIAGEILDFWGPR